MKMMFRGYFYRKILRNTRNVFKHIPAFSGRNPIAIGEKYPTQEQKIGGCQNVLFVKKIRKPVHP
jgi:hypothetical protein